MKNKLLKKSLILGCCAVLSLGILSACGQKEAEVVEETIAENADESEEAEKEPETEADEVKKPKYHKNEPKEGEIPQFIGYDLIWNDEFDGTKLDETKWNYEPHEPGWTNAELQEYTTSTDNVYVEDGNLVIQALKTKDKKGKDYYTSGKVTGQKKTDFMYGKVVVRAKVPEGKGLWPAIWMMPTDEGYYGQWPKCGEIDIMEVLGDQTNIAYGTIHYGEPHAEQQGIYTLEQGSFSEDFHEYSVEWEPGEMRFYIDGNLYHTVNDWFTCVSGEDEKPYPAPFDQTFFVQMNLAVGGTWPGNPDENTDFDNAKFLIDYVRVYQKPKYNTDVEKPVVIYRDILPDGNLIYNGDFADDEALDDEENWFFLLFEGGKGSAAINDGIMTITTEEMGTVDYSVQLVQPDLPMIKGTKYRLTFDAYAAEERDMVVCVSAPTAGWIRYLQDTKLTLSTDWQTYTYDFEMTEKNDNNGRLEFNMGNKGSTAEIYIANVRIEIVE